MLEIRDVEVAYEDLQAIWGVSMEVAAGEIVVLIGPNGAGKTTLMRAIAGLQPPLRGRIVLDGAPIQSLAAHSIVERGVVLVPEGRRLFAGMSVYENLLLGAYTAKPPPHPPPPPPPPPPPRPPPGGGGRGGGGGGGGGGRGGPPPAPRGGPPTPRGWGAPS